MSTDATQKNARPLIDLVAIEGELKPLSPEQLRSTIVECFGKAAEFIARAAVCVKLLDDRKQVLTGLPHIGTLRKVAYGRTLAEVAWAFIESPGREDIIRAPLPDQKKLAANPVYPVVEPAAGGGTTTRMTDLTKASRETVRQALGPEGLRSVDEQLAYLASQSRNRPKPRLEAEPDEVGEPLNRSITVRLTESEKAALTINAARARITEQEMARRGLIRSGTLREGKA